MLSSAEEVVELSNWGAENEERIWEAETKGNALEAAVARLGAKLEERKAREELREISKPLKGEKKQDADRHDVDTREVQEAYAKVVRELETFGTPTTPTHILA